MVRWLTYIFILGYTSQWTMSFDSCMRPHKATLYIYYVI